MRHEHIVERAQKHSRTTDADRPSSNYVNFAASTSLLRGPVQSMLNTPIFFCPRKGVERLDVVPARVGYARQPLSWALPTRHAYELAAGVPLWVSPPLLGRIWKEPFLFAVVGQQLLDQRCDRTVIIRCGLFGCILLPAWRSNSTSRSRRVTTDRRNCRRASSFRSSARPPRNPSAVRPGHEDRDPEPQGSGRLLCRPHAPKMS
jgi:hypothetical protein